MAITPRDKPLETALTWAVVAVVSSVALASVKADTTAGSNRAKLVELGRALFFDPRFSRDGSVSCATCHDPGKAFADARPLALGIGDRRGTRNTPTLLDLDAYRSFFWDGRTETLESQVALPLTSPVEMGLPSTRIVDERLHQAPSYEPRFREAFGTSGEKVGSYERFVEAIVAYERSLLSGTSRFDRFHLRRDQAALSMSEQRGFEVFVGRGHCADCHRIDSEHAWFTDGAYRPSGGAPVNTSVPVADLAKDLAALPPNQRLLLVSGDPDVAALGRFVVTLNPNDIGSFRTPSLRNVALTAPYMHDGSITALPEAIEWELYVRGGQLGQPIDLSPADRSDLLAFLKTLTSVDDPQ